MKHQVTRDLFTYWDSLRGGRPAPERSDIDPAEIHQILGDTFILEYENEDQLTFRLAGTRLCGSFCRELKGRSFLDIWSQEDIASVRLLLTAVAEDEAAAVIGFEGKTERDQTLNFETILLPLRHFGQTKSRILGAASPVEMPYWVGIWPLTELSISSMRLIWPDERPAFMRHSQKDSAPKGRHGIAPSTLAIPNPVAGRPMSRPNTRSAVQSEQRFGHLRVIEGGRSE
ncbi:MULTISPECIES: PAS domain-containing protein [Cohaesibacter]|uniref:PAS domain-containing protein n=1 Tax=Cohaesibacter TaxID=655352 RepID=UPI000DE9CDE5|nr:MULTISPECIES: PAS domain-containing protein [Cohaesibacter]TLP48643.1 PAS domain-containing protein [Cohaesibacter sp. CAU 1516]